jgi:short-subunit dehydrogenase
VVIDVTMNATSPERRTALVTGASSGLGACFARHLAAQGYDQVLVARRVAALEDVAVEIRREHGVEVVTLAADLSDPAAPESIREELQRRSIHVDYLVNNAGSSGPDLLSERDWTIHRRFYDLMMTSVAQMCHLFIPDMRANGFGRVINVSSMSGRIARSGGCNYGPAKAYVVAVSEDLALTLAGTGVNVCALCPGYTHTEFHTVANMLDMKRNSPSFIWYDADTVVREGLAAVERGKRVYPSGRLYRWLDPLLQSVWTRRFIRLGASIPQRAARPTSGRR